MAKSQNEVKYNKENHFKLNFCEIFFDLNIQKRPFGSKNSSFLLKLINCYTLHLRFLHQILEPFVFFKVSFSLGEVSQQIPSFSDFSLIQAHTS